MAIMKLGWHVTAAAAITLAAFGLGPVLGMTGSAVAPETTFEVLLDQAAERTAEVFVTSAVAAPLELGDLASAAGEGAGIPTEQSAAEGTARVRLVAPKMERRGEGSRASLSSSTKSAPAKAEAAPAAKKGCEKDPNPFVERTSGGHFTVDRALLKPYTKSFSALNSLGWSRQHEGDDGRPDGMLIGGVSCGNDLHDAGFRSGDVIHSVNGIAVRSIPEALLVYGRVKNDDRITIRLTRRGGDKDLVFKLTG